MTAHVPGPGWTFFMLPSCLVGSTRIVANCGTRPTATSRDPQRRRSTMVSPTLGSSAAPIRKIAGLIAAKPDLVAVGQAEPPP